MTYTDADLIVLGSPRRPLLPTLRRYHVTLGVGSTTVVYEVQAPNRREAGVIAREYATRIDNEMGPFTFTLIDVVRALR